MSEQIPIEPLALVRTRQWLENVVIGLNLCPFAAAPYRASRVRFVCSVARTEQALLESLAVELEALQAVTPSVCETTLLVHPYVLGSFDAYNQFLDYADALLDEMGLSGEIQIASFHPDYCFAGCPADDPANLSNRSPFPMLHLLREESIESVLQAGANTEEIVERNQAVLRGLDERQIQQLMPGVD